jgi:hypothetical protein
MDAFFYKFLRHHLLSRKRQKCKELKQFKKAQRDKDQNLLK